MWCRAAARTTRLARNFAGTQCPLNGMLTGRLISAASLSSTSSCDASRLQHGAASPSCWGHRAVCGQSANWTTSSRPPSRLSQRQSAPTLSPFTVSAHI
eukprot:4299700-Pleurochrysis_carterae.AAC.1